MGCKASTIREDTTTTTAPTGAANKPMTPRNLAKSASPVRAARSATPRAATPKAEEQTVVAEEQAVAAEDVHVEDGVVFEVVPMDAVAVEDAKEPTIFTVDVVVISEAVSPAPVVEEELVQPVAPVEKKKRRHGKKAAAVDAENVAPMMIKIVDAVTPKRVFGNAVINTASPLAPAPELAMPTSAKKAVTFTATTKSFERKMEAPLVSRKAKTNVGLRSKSGKSNIQMDVYLQQCAAFERLLTNVNTFEMQMNSR